MYVTKCKTDLEFLFEKYVIHAFKKVVCKKNSRICQLLLALLFESNSNQLSRQIVTSLFTSCLGQGILRHIKWGGNKASSK